MSISSIGGSFGSIRPEAATRQTTSTAVRDTAEAVASISNQADRAPTNPAAAFAPVKSAIAPETSLAVTAAAASGAATSGADRRQDAARAYSAAANLA
jgi:hypothetical protein